MKSLEEIKEIKEKMEAWKERQEARKGSIHDPNVFVETEKVVDLVLELIDDIEYLRAALLNTNEQA